MSVSKDIEKVLSDFGINIVTDSRTNLKKKLHERAVKTLANSKYPDKSVKDVTSRLSASIVSKVSYNTGGIKLTINMNDYWDIVENGRKPAPVSKEGQASIQKWAQTRGFAEKIRLSDLQRRKDLQSKNKTKRKKKVLKKMDFNKASKIAAFLVARSLKNKKLEPTHFFSEVIRDGRVEELKQKLSALIKTDIIINIRDGISS